MKCQLFIKWFLSIFLVTLITIMILTALMPKFIEVISEIVSQSSADIVANQLSSLITVSASAPNYIKITYSPSKSILYDVSSYNRRLIVKPYYGVQFMKNLESERFFAVDLNDFKYEKVNTFEIFKRNESGKIFYEFFAYRGEED